MKVFMTTESRMTDHEMCLRAAKAAGYTVEDRGTYIVRMNDDGIPGLWRPLVSGEDNHRLMVDCDVEARFYDDVVTCRVYWENIEVTERVGTDKHAATRRAAVRAAAGMREKL